MIGVILNVRSYDMHIKLVNIVNDFKKQLFITFFSLEKSKTLFRLYTNILPFTYLIISCTWTSFLSNY